MKKVIVFYYFTMKFSIICIRIWIDYCHVEWRNISRQWPTDKKYKYSQPQWLFWFSTILVLHHRHFHVITGTSIWFWKNPSSKFGDYRHLYFGAVGFTYLYSVNRFVDKETAFKIKYDQFISHLSILGWLQSSFKSISFAYMESSERYGV